MVVTEQDFLEWIEHPITKAFKKALWKNREVLKENLIRGNYTNQEQVQGMAEAITQILVMDYNDLMDSLSEGD